MSVGTRDNVRSARHEEKDIRVNILTYEPGAYRWAVRMIYSTILQFYT